MDYIKKIMLGYIIVSSLFVVLSRGSKLPIDLAKELQKNGYPADTQEQIEAATNAESYYVRFSALKLLKQRIGNKAIPTLKKALNDTEFEVRWRVAHFLGELGDKSGLERMRTDLNKFAPNKGAPTPLDPNITDPTEIKELKNRRNLFLLNATKAARVLAELGDLSGHELASRMVLEGDWELQKHEGIRCLIEIAKIDKMKLRKENIDPIFTLRVVAESEKNVSVLRTLTSRVATELDNDTAVQILEIAKNAPGKPEKARRETQIYLDLVKKRIKAESSGKR